MMKKDEKNSLPGRTIYTRSIAASTPASNEHGTPGLRRSARGMPTAKPATPASATRKSDKPTPSPVSVSKKSGGKDKNTPSPMRRSDRGKNVVSSQKGSDNSGEDADTSLSIEQKTGVKKNSVEQSTNEIKKRNSTMTGRRFKALWKNNKSEALADASNDKKGFSVGRSLCVSSTDDDDDDAVQNGKADCPPSENSETRSLPLEKGTDSILKSVSDTEKPNASPMVETGDGNAIVSPSPCAETQNLQMETNIGSPLKRKRDTAECELDACANVANGDVLIMSSDGVIQSLSGCEIDDEPEKCNACGKRQKVNSDFQNLSICSCIAQPVKESDHVEQDMEETEPATSRDYDENMHMQKGKSSDPKLYSSMYPEYWVPVQLSDVQVEQYCRTLFSKSLYLSSLTKKDCGTLEETLSSVRKTCDHPYVTDSTFKQMLTKNLELHEFLDVEIQASGKLHLLDAMLTHIKRNGLKAVVFYQATQSREGLLLGNILEDFVTERFGQKFYEHVISYSKITNAINKFNSESECCVLLLETRACSPAIKLLRAEAFILFGSSLNPSLDVKHLEKIKIESCAERTKIFRLYSVCTVEERSLILAKQNKWQNKAVDLTRSLTHALLMWGASYLFDKLDHFHGSETPESRVSEQSILDGVMHEFSSILSSKGGEGNGGKLRLLLEAKYDQGNYSIDSTLFGEEHVKLSDENCPNIFWTKLFKGKNPMWKYRLDTPQRNRKRVQYFEGSAKSPNLDNVGNTKRQKKASDNFTDLPVANDERNVSVKNHMGVLGSPKDLALQSSRKSTSGTDGTLDGNDAFGLYSMGVQISGIPEDMLFGLDCRKIPRESQSNLHAVLKLEMAKLGKVLYLSEACTSMVEQFLEYVIDHHRIYEKPATTFQAFQIALSWIAALLVKEKLSHKESLVRAKSELAFNCSRGEVDYIYTILSCMKSLFLERKKGLQFDCCGSTSSRSTTGINQVNEILSRATLRQGNNNMESMRSSEGEECVTEKKCSHYNTATKDIDETLRRIKKKCKKQLQKLGKEHDGKKLELLKKYADKKQNLETRKKLETAVIQITCLRTSTQADELKQMEYGFERQFDEVDSQKNECLQNLEQMHEAAKKKWAEDEACWIRRIKNWEQAELKISIPNKSGDKHISGMYSSNTSHNNPDVQTCIDANAEATYADTNCMASNGMQVPEAEITSRTMSGGSNQQVHKMVGLRNDKEVDVSTLSPDQPTDNVATKSHSSEQVSNTLPEISIPTGCQKEFAALKEYQSCDRITSALPDEDVSSRVPEVSQSLADLAKSASPEVSLNREEALVTTESNRTSHVGSDADSILDQQNRETCSLDNEIPDEVLSPMPHPVPVVETRGATESDQDDQDICPMPSALAGKELDPAANAQGQNIEAATEPESVEHETLETTDFAASSQGHQVTCPLPSSPAASQPVPEANVESQNIKTSSEPLIAGPDAVESAYSAVSDQETMGAQDACSLPPALVGTQPDIGPNIEGQNIITTAEPLRTGPGAVESGDYAVSNQEPMGAQGACSLPPAIVGTQPDIGPNIEGQNIITTADPLITGPGAVESGDDAVSDQETIGAQDACSLPPAIVGTQPDIGPNIDGQNIITTAEPLTTGPGAVESGDYAVSDQETMGAQDACSLPPATVGTQQGPNIEGQNITTVAQLPTDGLDSLETGGSLVLDQGAQDASPLPLSVPVNTSNVEVVNNTTVAEMEIEEPGPQVERTTFANTVDEAGVEPSVSVTAPVPSVLTNSMGQSAVQPVPQIPFPVFSDPFLHELEKLRRESEYSKNAYEEKKSVLKNEFERKIAELQAEYQRKIQEAEAEHNTKSEELKTQKNLIIMNKLLASAFLSKCTEKKTSPSEDPKGRIQQLAQRAIQENALRNYIASTPAQSPLHPQGPSSVSRPSGRPLNSAVCPMPQPRQPLISNVTPTPSASPATNQVAIGSLRHTAPHLTPTPSASPATNQVANASLRHPTPHITSTPSASPATNQVAIASLRHTAPHITPTPSASPATNQVAKESLRHTAPHTTPTPAASPATNQVANAGLRHTAPHLTPTPSASPATNQVATASLRHTAPHITPTPSASPATNQVANAGLRHTAPHLTLTPSASPATNQVGNASLRHPAPHLTPTPSASPATNQVAHASLRHPAPHLTPTPSASPATNQVAHASLRRPAPHLSSYRPSSLAPPGSTATLTSSSPLTSQAVTYSGVFTQQQEQQQPPQQGLSNGLQGNNNLVYVSDDE